MAEVTVVAALVITPHAFGHFVVISALLTHECTCVCVCVSLLCLRMSVQCVYLALEINRECACACVFSALLTHDCTAYILHGRVQPRVCGC